MRIRVPIASALAVAAALLAVGVRLWNALAGPRLWGHDAWGHAAYVLFLDTYRGLPWADQGWSYFHPPLHYALAAPLARSGDPELLMRGMPLLASAASLAIAGCAAWLVRASGPRWPWLAALGFAAVALLPVQLAASAMPGNEPTAAALGAASLCALVANERRARPRLAGDALCGALAGAALLAKLSGGLALVAALATVVLRSACEPERRRRPARALARALVLAGTALALCAPYYARNAVELGTPFALSRSTPLVARVEQGQPPGARGLRDYLRFPLAVFDNPDPRSPAMLRSVWGSVYANAWWDVHYRTTRRAGVAPAAAGWMALAGLLPTALALFGAGLAARDVAGGRRRAVYVPLGLSAAASLAAFALFAAWAPIWSSLKASYLLGLSLPFAAALARALEAIDARRAVTACVGALALVGAAAAATSSEGLVSPRRGDSPAAGAVWFAMGDHASARRLYAALLRAGGEPLPWVANLAAVELADGRPDAARDLYARALSLAGREDRELRAALAVARAAAGELVEAEAELDALLAAADEPALRANRGAVRAARGASDAAAEDLREATRADPELTPAWLALAELGLRRGDVASAERARTRARAAACRAPRGHPYAVGSGEVVEWRVGRRWLLRLDGDRVVPATRDFYRDACAALGREG